METHLKFILKRYVWEPYGFFLIIIIYFGKTIYYLMTVSSFILKSDMSTCVLLQKYLCFGVFTYSLDT